MLMTAEYIARDVPVQFCQADIEFFRILIASSIMDLKLA